MPSKVSQQQCGNACESVMNVLIQEHNRLEVNTSFTQNYKWDFLKYFNFFFYVYLTNEILNNLYFLFRVFLLSGDNFHFIKNNFETNNLYLESWAIFYMLWPALFMKSL
jgi:hypothetical protein